MVVESITLYFQQGSSDKVYQVELSQVAGGFSVTGYNGRRGATLTAQVKTPTPVSEAQARAIYNKTVAEKRKKGYTPGPGGATHALPDATAAPEQTGILPQLLNPIDRDAVEPLLADTVHALQEKLDGHRCIVQLKNGTVRAINRQGNVRALPDVISRAIALLPADVVIDGELIGETYHAFDHLESSTTDLRSRPFAERHASLQHIIDMIADRHVVGVPLYVEPQAKRAAYSKLEKHNAEGAVFKLLSAPYTVGRPASGGSQVKAKFWESASCLVTEHNTTRSVQIAMVDDDGNDVPVGNVTVKANQAVPPIGAIVEVKYLYAYQGGSLYQPELLGVRDDVTRDDCRVSSLKFKAAA